MGDNFLITFKISTTFFSIYICYEIINIQTENIVLVDVLEAAQNMLVF